MVKPTKAQIIEAAWGNMAIEYPDLTLAEVWLVLGPTIPDDKLEASTCDDLRDALADMVNQFAYETKKDGAPALWTGGLSALEWAFDVLGYTDPYPVPDRACEYPGCNEFASCGTPTIGGYKQCCGNHMQEYQRELKEQAPQT